jgi:hypothetical protein
LSEERLPTELWVQAHLRRCSVDATPAALLRRGESERGTVLLKLNLDSTASDPGRDLMGAPAGWPRGLASGAGGRGQMPTSPARSSAIPFGSSRSRTAAAAIPDGKLIG